MNADLTQATQKEFQEQVGLREIERQIDADLLAWRRSSMERAKSGHR